MDSTRHGGKVELTGSPLLVISFVATLGAVVLTVLSWRRGGRTRVLTRTGCILLCEGLTLFTAGLAVNDSFGDLYPSWSTLFQSDATPPPSAIAAGPDTSLDRWLMVHAHDAAKTGLLFDWKPRALTGWHLPAAPTVYVPPAYFTDTNLRFPVVVVVAPMTAGPNQAGWDPAALRSLVARSTADRVPAILVFLRVDHPDTGNLLQRDLPGQLEADMRVNDRGWSVVAVGSDAGTGLTALSSASARYRSAVIVAGADGVVPAPLVARAYQARLDQAVLVIPGPPLAAAASASAGPGSGQGGDGSTAAADAVTVQPVAQPGERIVTALRWTYQQLSPPLAVPITGPIGSVPPPPGRR